MAKVFENLIISDSISFDVPLIWLVGAVIFLITAIVIIFKENMYMLPVTIFSFVQFPVWIIFSDIPAIYEYIGISVFIVISLMYLIYNFTSEYPQGKYLVYAYLGLVIIMFILFYPMISGYIVPESYVKYVKWLDTWSF